MEGIGLKYTIELNDEQEKFLDMYLKLFPLRPEHKREDYPGLIPKNFINSLMDREAKTGEMKEQYLKKFGVEP